MKAAERLSGAQKAAILLLCLGEEAAAQIFQSLDDSEVRDISRCMIDVEHVDPELARAVLEEYKESKVNRVPLCEGCEKLTHRLEKMAEEK